jgi:hypothetical protein
LDLSKKIVKILDKHSLVDINIEKLISIRGLGKAKSLQVLALLELSKRIYEWDIVRDWMWENRDSFTGLSILPYDGGTYVQAPFEECTKEKYEEMMKHLTEVDLYKIIELTDDTNLSGELACAGGTCEVK